MFNRTMSYLFLTVVAAAVFLVSGCAPIDNQGGQVKAVEADRIQKLESQVAEVAKAVQAAQPEAIKSQVKNEVQAVQPEAIEKAAEAVLLDKNLKDKLIRLLCRYKVTITIDKLAYEQLESKDKALLNKAGLDRADKDNDYVYTSDSFPSQTYDKLVNALNKYTGESNFAGVPGEDGCEIKGTGRATYLAVKGKSTTDRTFTISIDFELEIPADAKAWIAIPEKHWLYKTKQPLKFIMSPEIAKVAAPHWNKEIGKPHWHMTLTVAEIKGKTPTQLMQETLDIDKSYTSLGYVMIYRERKNRETGEVELRVIDYQQFHITATKAGGMKPLQAELSAVGPKDVPCFPMKMDEGVHKQFKEFLSQQLRPRVSCVANR